MKTVVFDLDDTLYPEAQYIDSGFKRVADHIERKYGIKNVYSELNRLFYEDRNNVYNRLFKSRRINCGANDISILVKIYRENKPEKLDLYPGAMELLLRLKKKGVPLGVITDGRVSQQNAKINALRIRDCFDEIVISDSLGGEQYRKPDKRVYLYMASKLKIEPGEMIYIGDNPEKDFAIKKDLPVTTVRLMTRGIYGQSEYKLGIKPDYIANDYYDLSEVLDKMLK